jgi:hypothetical protein
VHLIPSVLVPAPASAPAGDNSFAFVRGVMVDDAASAGAATGAAVVVAALGGLGLLI